MEAVLWVLALMFVISLVLNGFFVWQEGRDIKESLTKTLSYIVVCLAVTAGFLVVADQLIGGAH